MTRSGTPSCRSSGETATARFSYLGSEVQITYVVGRDGPKAVVNGREVGSTRRDVVLDKEHIVIPDRAFEAGKRCDVRHIRSG